MRGDITSEAFCLDFDSTQTFMTLPLDHVTLVYPSNEGEKSYGQDSLIVRFFA